MMSRRFVSPRPYPPALNAPHGPNCQRNYRSLPTRPPHLMLPPIWGPLQTILLGSGPAFSLGPVRAIGNAPRDGGPSCAFLLEGQASAAAAVDLWALLFWLYLLLSSMALCFFFLNSLYFVVFICPSLPSGHVSPPPIRGRRTPAPFLGPVNLTSALGWAPKPSSFRSVAPSCSREGELQLVTGTSGTASKVFRSAPLTDSVLPASSLSIRLGMPGR